MVVKQLVGCGAETDGLEDDQLLVWLKLKCQKGRAAGMGLCRLTTRHEIGEGENPLAIDLGDDLVGMMLITNRVDVGEDLREQHNLGARHLGHPVLPLFE